MAKNQGKELEKLKKLEEQFAKKKAALITAKGHIKERERKTRMRRLYRVGALTETAQIFEHDEAALLGGFLHLAELMADQSTYQKFKVAGQKTISETTKKTKGA
jgi:diphthamide synthase (EF-2-diphthine--ammonia ligase)